jgi:hypothetical protein
MMPWWETLGLLFGILTLLLLVGLPAGFAFLAINLVGAVIFLGGEAGLMQEVTVDGHRSYFDTRMDDHPHFYWEDRGELTDAPAEDLKIMGLPAAPDGTEVSRVDVVIRLRRV